MIFWTICLLLSTGECTPLEGAPTFPTQNGCEDALIPWMQTHFESMELGTYTCGTIKWTST